MPTWRSTVAGSSKSGSREATPVSIAAIVLCISASLFAWSSSLWYGRLIFIPQLFAEGELWRPLTSTFVHTGPAHLVLNVLAIWTVGRRLERLLGGERLLALSLVGMVGSCAAEAWFSAGATGFSGVLFAWMGACVPYARSLGLDLGKTLLLNLVVSFLPGVSLAGHLGGFLVGVPLGTAHRESAWKPAFIVTLGVSSVVLLLRVLL